MIKLIKEDFSDFKLSEYPYDAFHTALGEYHHYMPLGYRGNFSDPISLHQYRSLGGNFLVTNLDGKYYMEQNRGDNATGAYSNVYSVLSHNTKIYANYTLKVELRVLELKHYCSIGFLYKTSRNYYAVGIKGNRLELYKRTLDDFLVIKSKEIYFDDLKTYNIKIVVSNTVLVYLDDVFAFDAKIEFEEGLKVALIAKSACRYSNLEVLMTEDDYNIHLQKIKEEEQRLLTKQKEYPPLKLIKKIDLKDFSTGRQLRIRNVDGKTIFVMAQHQKRMMRDSFARLSCLTVFDIDGNILWQRGKPNNDFENTLISCDLPFQIADMNNDGKYEIIYSIDFYVYIADLLTGKILKSMPTPKVYEDPLVKNHPYYRLNVDAIRVADFKGLGYKGNFIIKDRYQNVWAYDENMQLMWRYHHKNTGHFPYIYDFDDDGKDEMFVGYDLIDHDGTMVFSLPMNSDHTDEIIYASLDIDQPKRLILASGNEGMNICNIDGTIYKHNNIGHAQRISVAKYKEDIEGLQICATSFWGADGIICIYDKFGNLLCEKEQTSNGNLVTPVNYDGKHSLILLHASTSGGLVDGSLDTVVNFPLDGHPTICQEVFDIDDDGVDEILCWDLNSMWIYKAESYVSNYDYDTYPKEGFSNYRGEYLIPSKYLKKNNR